MRLLFAFALLIGAAHALYGPNSKVLQLNSENFAAEVFGTTQLTLVEFYAPWCGHCKQLAPQWEKVASYFDGMIKVAALDADKYRDIGGQFGIQGFPTIKLFPGDITKQGNRGTKIPIDYNGPRTAAAITKFALSKLDAKHIVKVDGESIDEFAEGTQPKLLLFTDKARTSNLYKAVSMKYHMGLKIGQASSKDSTLAEKYQVEEFPKLLLLKVDDVQIYSGGMKWGEISKWISSLAGEPRGAAQKEKPKTPSPPPEELKLVHLESQDAFELACVNKRAICLIGFLPSQDDDKEAFDEAVGVLANVVELQKFNPQNAFVVSYAIAKDQEAFAKQFDVSVYDVPRLVAFSPSRKRYTPLFGSFSVDGVKGFMESVLAGKRSIPIDDVPKLN